MGSVHFKISTAGVLVALFLWTGFTYGQKNTTDVYLKDRTVIRGQILVDNDFYVRIVKLSNDTVQVGYKNISSVGKRPKLFRVRPERVVRKQGIAISAMGNAIFSEDSETLWNAHVVVAKRSAEGKANLGIAIGYDKFDFVVNSRGLENKFLSTSFYGRYYLDHKTTRFLVDGRLGYAWALGSINANRFIHDYNGEISSTLGIGFHLPSRSNISTLIRTGVNYLRTKGEFSFTGGNENKTAYTRRFIHPYLGIALEF